MGWADDMYEMGLTKEHGGLLDESWYTETENTDSVTPHDYKSNADIETGVVKWFNDEIGFGFIVSDVDGEEVFAHYSRIQYGYKSYREAGYCQLRAGWKVRYQRVKSRNGGHAESIYTVISEHESIPPLLKYCKYKED